MSKCIVPKAEWSFVGEGELKEKQRTDNVRKTFCQCLDTLLFDYLKEAITHADARSEKRILTQRHANYAARKTTSKE